MSNALTGIPTEHNVENQSNKEKDMPRKETNEYIFNQSNVHLAFDNALHNKPFVAYDSELDKPIIYNCYNDDIASEDREHAIFDNYIEVLATEVAKGSVQQLNKVSKDYYSNASHIIRFCKGEPIMGNITAYNLKQGIYTIQYTTGKQERLSHKAILLPYCPPTKRIVDDIL